MIAPFLTSVVLSALFVLTVRTVARRRRLFAVPTNDRWHDQPIPKFGGIAMAAALGLVVVVSGAAATLWPVLAGSGLLFVVGLVDDVSPIRPFRKLALQIVVAVGMVLCLPAVNITGARLLDTILSVAWIVTITNAFNLLDNIDGLAAGAAAITGTFLLLLLRWQGNPAWEPITIGCAALVGVNVGFLLFNFHPATIFMGDAGSHLIGAGVAGLSMLAAPSVQSHGLPLPAVGLSLLAVPLFDTIFVAITRQRAGRSPFIGGRDHTSHRLVATGLNERRAVLTLYGLCAMAGIVALGFARLPEHTAWTSAALFGATLLLVAVYLANVEVIADRPYSSTALARVARGRAVLVYGAGRGGRLTARELRQNASLALSPIGFIDDDPGKRRKRVDELPVLGGLDQLPALLDNHAAGIEAVIISVRDLPRQTLDRLCAVCDARGLEVRRMSFTLESVDQRVQLRAAK